MKLKRITVSLISVVVCISLLSATLVNTYDTASPLGSDDPREADDRMREIKASIQERMNDYNGNTDEGDHYWPLTGTEVSDTDTGQHRKLTLREISADPDSEYTGYASFADLGILYTKVYDSEAELFYQDEDGDVVQLTADGKLGGVDDITIVNAAPNITLFETDGSWSGGAASHKVVVSSDDLVIQEADPTDDGTYNDVITIANEGDITIGFLDDGLTRRKISSIADPTSDQDVATKKFVDDKHTEAGTWQTDGTTVFNTGMAAANTFQDLDLSGYVGANASLCFLEIYSASDPTYSIKTKGYGAAFTADGYGEAAGVGKVKFHVTNQHYIVMAVTDSSGIVQHGASNTDTIVIKLIGFVK